LAVGSSVEQRLCVVGFDAQVEVQRGQDCDAVNQTVQALPNGEGEALHGLLRRRPGQRHQQHQRKEADRDERALGDVAQHRQDVETLIWPQIQHEVQKYREECQ
jgi:hypothetical protein